MGITLRKKLHTPIVMLQISIGILYVWFGMLKFFPGLSPAEDLAKETIHLLTFGVISPEISILLLAVWETAVGILLLFGLFHRATMVLVLTHMALTFTPLILLPQVSFTHTPYALTLVGQYIIKNITIVCALIVINTSRTK